MGAFAFDFTSENIYTVSAKAVSKVLEAKNPDAALVLLYIMREGGQFDPEAAMRELGISRSRFLAALDVIEGGQLPNAANPAVEKQPEKAEERPAPSAIDAVRVNSMPSYTRAELAGAMENRDFAFIYAQAEKAVGHPLLQYEVSALMMIYDYLRLPANVIALLINHVVRESERKSTPEHPVSVSFRDIKSEAVRWHEHGITTVAEAERYIKDWERKRSATGRVLRMLGITGRTPSPTERRYIDLFVDLDPSLELIALAYDLTVTKKGALIWPYMRSILLNWSRKGYKTPADIEEGERGYKNSSSAYPHTEQDAPGHDYDERVLQYFKQNKKKGE